MAHLSKNKAHKVQKFETQIKGAVASIENLCEEAIKYEGSEKEKTKYVEQNFEKQFKKIRD